MNVIERITSLRNLMQIEKIDALLIYGADPHLSEYLPDAWKTIEWITGFNGSYGKVIITSDKALLWTDSRYYIQAEEQLRGTGIVMMKDRHPDTIPVEIWLSSELKNGNTVAVDGQTVSYNDVRNLRQKLGAKGLNLIVNKDLVSKTWMNRPQLVQNKIADYPIQFSGQSCSDKLLIIRNRLRENNATATLICQLDDLAWTLNLRGSEIKYIPCFTGYVYIDLEEAILFVNQENLASGQIETLNSEGIHVADYNSRLLSLEKKMPSTIYLDPDRTNSLIYEFYSERTAIIEGIAIPTGLKSIKNKIEIAGMKASHRRDGVAVVNFLYWLEKHLGTEPITEMSIAEKLEYFRSEQRHYTGESFSPIVGFGPHGAIVHYSATPETDKIINRNGLLLIDSGGQYLDGTTDITRTIGLGKIDSRQQRDFTLVLKGMIGLAMAKFPVGTRGYSLDSIARIALWNNGLNYGHGTGHGVGHYLSVHEGPMSIRTEYNSEPIREGQILSNEPGLYRQGEYGIRIENVMLCQKERYEVFGPFLSFETLTLCPIDRRLIKRQLLNTGELNWLNSYHKKVLSKLKPYLKPEVLKWLTIQCESI